MQRVTSSQVDVRGEKISSTGPGLLVLLGVARGDTEEDALYLARKTVSLRIFEDDRGKMNLSVRETGGEIMVISQFTLVADTRKGNRPGFDTAADPDKAEPLYQLFVQQIERQGIPTKSGVFGADMAVSLCNDGPVTFLLESK